MTLCVTGLSPEKQAAYEEDLRRARLTSVYRYYDDRLALMYAGIAGDFCVRDRFHLFKSPWRHRAMFAEVFEYDTREIALAVEAWMHQDERPPCCRKFEMPLGPREDLPPPPKPEWFFVGQRDPIKLDDKPQIDEDGIPNFFVDGEHLCVT